MLGTQKKRQRESPRRLLDTSEILEGQNVTVAVAKI